MRGLWFGRSFGSNVAVIGFSGGNTGRFLGVGV